MHILFLNLKISSTPKEKSLTLSVFNKPMMFFNFESSNYFFLTFFRNSSVITSVLQLMQFEDMETSKFILLKSSINTSSLIISDDIYSFTTQRICNNIFLSRMVYQLEIIVFQAFMR